uniref:Chromodomain helicase DNA binding protein 7 n=1 Tax=Gasterosteus aculeatus aculeatus TaxID=481459 RepID=A0AAQ4PVP2_GASAC
FLSMQLELGEEAQVEEFYVKFKGFSYLHCRWADLEELEKDKRIHQKVKRFRAKQQLNSFIMDDEPFNPDYVEVDRVLDISESPDENGETVTLYLVKWCSLPYEDSTWELKADIDQSKIEEYERIAARTPNTTRMDRPPAADWKQLEGSRDYKNSNALREYQLEGLNWLTFNWYNSRNCILADEMGLGKTIQSITFLYEMFMKGIEGPFLVIAPLSTIPNWEREFRTWTELNAVVYHGSQASRKTIQAYEMYYRDTQGKIIKGAYRFHAIITTFEMILTDCPELRSVNWRCVVIDEAHRLKNRNCKLLEGLKMMDMEHKVLLTGTPLQNTVEELFSLLNFLEPERFPSEQTFMTEFGDLKTEEQVQKLQAILKPMMLRRLKEDVEKNLAPKEETIIEVELTNIQKKYYRAILEKNFSFLSKGGPGGGGGPNVPNLLNTMMELRKCCNHPYLINGAEEKIAEDFRESHGGRADMPDMALQAMVQAAGKLVLIDKLLPKLKAGGHRVLVFSQMVRCLDILEDYLIQKRYPYERIDGRVRGNLRQAAIDRFSRPDSDRFVFLLCTRAGGLGINLTAADTCIIFDSDWNPQNDLQAQARCHRIGQSKAVKIYRLITRNSYEREMFDKASLKLGLDKAVLQSMSGRENANSGVQQLSKKEVEDLLRKGAYGALMDEEDEGSKFCEEDIDQILQRRTHTITIESEGKGSTFAKASFVAAGNRTDISLEDPDFWQKWAKKAELDLDAMNGRNTLVIDTPRVRKQTRHFSSAKDDEMLEFSELESDEDEPSRPTSKPRRPQDKSQGYPRSECFRVEKNLLVYGWGRWSDILTHGRFKRPLKEADVETICRALLAYCLLHYRGDENIKSFIWDLITPSADGTTKTLTNHSGLSTPVPRGQERARRGNPRPPPSADSTKPIDFNDPQLLLVVDPLAACCRVLLRVRMLYYLRQEVIGDQADRILEGADSRSLDIWIPQPFHAEVPADWWESEADKSLLIGVFKHGYEKYNSMRADPALCFLERVGMPDAKAIAAEQRGSDMMTDGVEGEDEDPEYKPLRMPFKDEMEDFTNSPLDDKDEHSGENGQGVGGASGSSERLYWPAASALTARLRRLITAYQRSNRREQLRQEALSRPDGRRRRRRDFLWTRREEADFYRVVSTFGVVYDTQRQRFDWAQFRAFARLDKKTDESLEKYYYSFIAMCKRVCRMQVKTETELPDPTLIIDPITEERASRTLYRIELLRRIREQVLPHPLLSERLKLCQSSPDLPEWWENGRHDRDLLLGACKHGVSRTDYHILNDPALAFLEAHQRSTGQRAAAQGETTKQHWERRRAPRAPLHRRGDGERGRSLASGSVEEEEAAVSNKELGEWLRQHPTYTMDMTGFTPVRPPLFTSFISEPHLNALMPNVPPPPLPSYFLLPQKSDDALLSQFSKPKQKRHRCRNPNKIDINTLTGEERVPVVNRRNGRKASTLGTPPPRQPLWLLENPEYSIAPDWTDIVKQSGFLPEAMFDRLLTASNSMAATSRNTNGTTGGEGQDGDETAKTKDEEGEDFEEGGDEEEEAEGSEEGAKKARKKGRDGRRAAQKSLHDATGAPGDSSAESCINGDTAALLAAAGMSANSLAFNPFLLSTMAPGLLYPSMFLPPGLGGLSLPGFPTASTLAELQSAMAGALGGNPVTANPPKNEDEDEDEKEGLKASGEEEEVDGGKSDFGEEEGGEEGGAEPKADDSAPEDGGPEDEDEATSPQKDKSD